MNYASSKDMTTGSPARLIFFFSVPLMLGNIFQQVYTITDSLIISRSLGINALAALGSADWFDYMMVTIIQAAAQGCCILMAQDYGAGDEEHLQKVVASSLILAVVFSCIITIAALLLVNPVVVFLQTPEEIAWMTKTYLYWKFAGLSCSMLLNMSSFILRAFGNSTIPLRATVISAVLNIILDLLFVNVIHTGIAGAALATVIAQLSGGIICFAAVRRLPFIHLSRNDFHHADGIYGRMLKLSIPIMLSNIMISLGGILVQSRVNTFDLSFIAGYTATNKLYGALELAAVAYGAAVMTFVGQNYGAGRYDRIRSGLKSAVVIACLSSALIGIVMIVFGRSLTGMFITDTGQAGIEAGSYAYRFLRLLAVCLPILYILYVARNFLQGMGNSFIPMLQGIAEFCARVTMALFMPAVMGSSALWWAEIAAWCASDLLLITASLKTIHGFPKKITVEE